MRSSAGSACLLYDWRTGSDYLIPRVLPKARVLRARPFDDLAQILPRARDLTHFLFHLNLTRSGMFLPRRPQFVELAQQHGIRCLNAFAIDISKRALHDSCRRLGLPSCQATAQGDQRELLIVKTDLNYGGVNEHKLCAEERRATGIAQPSPAVLDIRAVMRAREARDASHYYPVLLRRDVPESWWMDDQLVIERYVENRQQRICRVHFLLDYAVVSIAVCRDIIKKMRSCESFQNYFYRGTEYVGAREEWLPARQILAETMALCRDMHVEFGAVDIVLDDDGRHFFIDVNPTAYGGPKENPIYSHMRLAIA